MSVFFQKLDHSFLGKDYELVLREFHAFRKNMENFILNTNLDVQCCPCCGYPTLKERGGYEICVICDWEDEDQDGERADEIWGGANGNISLTEARYNFNSSLYKYETQSGKKRIADPKEVILISSSLNSDRQNWLEGFSTDEDFEKFVNENAIASSEEFPYPFEVLTK